MIKLESVNKHTHTRLPRKTKAFSSSIADTTTTTNVWLFKVFKWVNCPSFGYAGLSTLYSAHAPIFPLLDHLGRTVWTCPSKWRSTVEDIFFMTCTVDKVVSESGFRLSLQQISWTPDSCSGSPGEIFGARYAARSRRSLTKPLTRPKLRYIASSSAMARSCKHHILTSWALG